MIVLITSVNPSRGIHSQANRAITSYLLLCKYYKVSHVLQPYRRKQKRIVNAFSISNISVSLILVYASYIVNLPSRNPGETNVDMHDGRCRAIFSHYFQVSRNGTILARRLLSVCRGNPPGFMACPIVTL